MGDAGIVTGRRAAQLIVLCLVAVALGAGIGGQAWSAANPKPVRAHVRVVEVVKPRGFDVRSAGIGAGAALAAVGGLAGAYVLFGLAARSRR